MLVVVRPSAQFVSLFPETSEQLCGLDSVLQLPFAPKNCAEELKYREARPRLFMLLIPSI